MRPTGQFPKISLGAVPVPYTRTARITVLPDLPSGTHHDTLVLAKGPPRYPPDTTCPYRGGMNHTCSGWAVGGDASGVPPAFCAPPP